LDQVAVLPIRSDPSPPTPATLLSLALRLQLPLATWDAELAEAAWAEGVGVLAA
jgi:rRNA-processing protein FCF1